MGLFDLFRSTPTQLSALASPASLSLASPMATNPLAQVVYSEYFAGEISEVSRLTALSIPAIKKARDVLVSIIAGMPLKEFEGQTETTPDWLTSTKSGISPWHRTAYCIDDLLFYDWSLLAVERDTSGQIDDSVRVPIERWSIDSKGRVLIDGKAVSAEEIVLIPGNGSGGILVAGASTIKGARALERAWIGRAQNPIPLIELHQITDEQLADDEITDLVDAWSAARTSPTGAVGFTDNRVQLNVHGTVATDLFEQGRNAIVLDVARLTGVPAAILDGSQSTATLTYSTTEGKRSEFDDYSLPALMTPFEARLSLDDVSPRGRVTRFDKSGRNATTAPTIDAPLED